MNNRRWLRYGLVGNFLSYGLGVGFMAYLAWIIYDIGQNQSVKMDPQLAKQVFTFTDAELKESAHKAKLNFLKRKQEKLQKQKQHSQRRKEENQRAEFI